MEREYCFACTAPEDRDRTQLEIAFALERRMDLYARDRCPRLTALTDKLNSIEKVPPEVSERRARRRIWFAALDWALGTLMLVAAWTDPAAMPAVLVAGILGTLLGIALFWKRKRGTVAIIQIAAGATLLFLGAADRNTSGSLLSLGAVYLAIGVVAAVSRHGRRRRTFEKQALPLAEKMAGAQGRTVRLIFSDTGMRLAVEEDVSQEYPNDQLEAAIETYDLLVLAFAGQGVALQKKDLTVGTLPDLRGELGRMHFTEFRTDET